jgi:hypothetical protein
MLMLYHTRNFEICAWLSLQDGPCVKRTVAIALSNFQEYGIWMEITERMVFLYAFAN